MPTWIQAPHPPRSNCDKINSVVAKTRRRTLYLDNIVFHLRYILLIIELMTTIVLFKLVVHLTQKSTIDTAETETNITDTKLIAFSPQCK